MGGTTSKETQETKNSYTDASVQSCTTPSTSSYVNIDHVLYWQPPDCPPSPASGFQSDQALNIDADCLIKSMAQTASDAANTLSATALGGLGITETQTGSTTQQTFIDYSESACSGSSNTTLANINHSIIRSCEMVVTQSATVQQSCQLNALQIQLSKIADAQAADSEGLSLGLIAAIIGLVIIVIIIIIAIGAIIAFALKSGGKTPVPESYSPSPSPSPEELTGGDYFRENPFCMILIIIGIIVIIIAILVIFRPKIGKKYDFNRYYQIANNARQVGGYDQIYY